MTVKTISKWVKGTKTCNLISVCKNGGDTRDCFTGWQPMPVKGWFNSSYHVLSQWMRENGWVCVPINIEGITIINH